MMVMPSNLRKMTLKLDAQFPGKVGLLLSPGGFTDPLQLPYALDNGRFAVWSAGREWSVKSFREFLDRVAALPRTPLWVAVPDVVADREATLGQWPLWARRLEVYGWPLAVVVQNGMTTDDVRGLDPAPAVVFVGGTTDWKWRSLPEWCRHFPRVHVGRVNGYMPLWSCKWAGAESCDGTGWWHEEQRRKLVRYLSRSSRGESYTDDDTLGLLERR